MLNKIYILVTLMAISSLFACSENDKDLSENQPISNQSIANVVDESKPRLTYNTAIYCAGLVHLLDELPEFTDKEKIGKYEAIMHSEALRLSDSLKNEDGSIKTVKDVESEIGHVKTDQMFSEWAVESTSSVTGENAEKANAEKRRKDALGVKTTCLPYLQGD